MLFGLWIPLTVAGSLIAIFAWRRKTEAAKFFVAVIIAWILFHLFLFAVSPHVHRIEDKNCHRAYIEHQHFDFMFHPIFVRSPHTDYDSYTCESEPETKQAHSSASTVSVPLT